MSIKSRKEQKEQQAQEQVQEPTSPVKPEMGGLQPGEDLMALTRRLAEAQIQMSKAQTQMANQIVEDHRILTDHEWRLHDIEGRLGITPSSPVVSPLAATQSIEPEPAPEPQSEPEPEPAPESQPEPQPEIETTPEPEVQVADDDGYEVKVRKEGWGTLIIRVKI